MCHKKTLSNTNTKMNICQFCLKFRNTTVLCNTAATCRIKDCFIRL